MTSEVEALRAEVERLEKTERGQIKRVGELLGDLEEQRNLAIDLRLAAPLAPKAEIDLWCYCEGKDWEHLYGSEQKACKHCGGFERAPEDHDDLSAERSAV